MDFSGFMLVGQFARNFLLILCVSTKMRFPAYFCAKIFKNLLHFLSGRGMLYPTQAELGYILFLEHPVSAPYHAFVFIVLFSSFTFLSFTLPVP